MLLIKQIPSVLYFNKTLLLTIIEFFNLIMGVMENHQLQISLYGVTLSAPDDDPSYYYRLTYIEALHLLNFYFSCAHFHTK